MSRAVVAHFLFVAAAVPPSPAVAENIQERFRYALSLIDQGKTRDGADALRVLYAEAPTPRIRVELARALMLMGEFKESKSLFVAAYDDNPSPVVKANILNFIDKIDRQKGKLTLSVAVARYGNPLQQPAAYSQNFGGVNLAYEPTAAYLNLFGITAGAQYQRELGNGLTVSANTSYRALTKKAVNRFTGDLSVVKQLRQDPIQFQIGVVRLSQRFQSFTLPYAQGTYTFSLNTHSAVQPSFRAGYYSSDAGPGVSGWQADTFLPYIYSPTPAKVFAFGLTALRHSVGFDEQSFTSTGARMSWSIHSTAINVETELQLRATWFDAVDPFFKMRRKEKGLYASISLSSDKFRIGPFVPGIVTYCDSTKSTIRFYQQSACDVQIIIRKLF